MMIKLWWSFMIAIMSWHSWLLIWNVLMIMITMINWIYSWVIVKIHDAQQLPSIACGKAKLIIGCICPMMLCSYWWYETILGVLCWIVPLFCLIVDGCSWFLVHNTGSWWSTAPMNCWNILCTHHFREYHLYSLWPCCASFEMSFSSSYHSN